MALDLGPTTRRLLSALDMFITHLTGYGLWPSQTNEDTSGHRRAGGYAVQPQLSAFKRPWDTLK